MRDYNYHATISVKTKILNQCRKIFMHGFAEKLLLKKMIASKGNSIWHKAVPPEYLYPTDSWRPYERNGIRLNLNISNVVDHVKYFGFTDIGFENFVKKIQPHFTVLDIGGNIGLTCLEFAKKVAYGQVISFEPSPANFKRLQENVSLNGFKNITLVNAGIGDAAGKFSLYNVVDSNPGMKRILNALHAENFESEQIVIDTLQNQLTDLNIKEVHAVKIDVEGFEFKVLQSAAYLLKKYRPILFIELDDANLKDQNSSAVELIQYLKALDYKIYEAQSLGNNLLDAGVDYSNCHFDIICE